MLQPLNRRTWAPRGETPVQYAWDRHDRLSVIGALTLSPKRRRIGVYFGVHDANVRTDDVMRFLSQLHRQVQRRLILVCDRWGVHRAAVRKLHEAGAKWLSVEWLPAYAPDLNPVEALWSYSKYGRLANFVADDVDHLSDAVIETVGDVHFAPSLKTSFFHAASLHL